MRSGLRLKLRETPPKPVGPKAAIILPTARPTRDPSIPPGRARIRLSIKNILRMDFLEAPMAIIIPISLVLRLIIIMVVLAMTKPEMSSIIEKKIRFILDWVDTNLAISRLNSCQELLSLFRMYLSSSAALGAASKSDSLTPISDTTSPWPTRS